jgi:NTP pyrophosphatase (non-canonical NTP hydrolase)
VQGALQMQCCCLRGRSLIANPNNCLLYVVRHQGSSRKYTNYSNETQITKERGQSTLDIVAPDWTTIDIHDILNLYGASTTITRLMMQLAEFAEERDWIGSHRPRNLMFGLMTEVGELAELVQWNGDRDSDISVELRDRFAQELGDIAIFLLRMTDLYGR